MNDLDLRKDPDLDLPFQNLGWIIFLSALFKPFLGFVRKKRLLVFLFFFLGILTIITLMFNPA